MKKEIIRTFLFIFWAHSVIAYEELSSRPRKPAVRIIEEEIQQPVYYFECSDEEEIIPCFDTAVSAGFVFKNNDCLFKRVYGQGVVNVITVDGCWYFKEHWGIGAQISYWHAKGKTTVLNRSTCLQEIPITFYVRKRWDCWDNFMPYLSLGGGFIHIREQSYLGSIERNAGIGQLEAGFNQYFGECFFITGALRYLFPQQRICRTTCYNVDKAEVGGVDLRIGFGFSY
jgi:hypothetical protein